MSHGRYVYIHTFGCQMNVYDTERMFQTLQDLDYEATSDAARADLILLNTCAVREKAEDKAFSMLGRYELLRRSNPNLLIGIGGCMSTRLKEQMFKKGFPLDIVFGPDNISELPRLIEEAELERGGRVSSFQFLPRSQYEFPVAIAPDDGRVSSMVTVMKGCNKFCSFCIVPSTRGREVSKPPAMVVDEVTRLVEQGVREVMLLGQNVNSYGHDLSRKSGDFDFAKLLHMVHEVSGLERIRFTTSHPWDATEELARAFGTLPKVCNYLHLPLQSGSDSVLQRMRRGYTLEKFVALVARLREHQPKIALSTDIIVGFPGETEDDFSRTLDAMNRLQFDSMYVFKYSERPDTAAARLTDDVPPEVKQERLLAVLKLQEEHTRRSLGQFIGNKEAVLFEGTSSRPDLSGQGLQMSGRTDTNFVVNVDIGQYRGNPMDLVGSIIDVEITESRRHSLFGRLA
jgi:tRNA-2-methylthio-N6-dimethylallyladenosine synthase